MTENAEKYATFWEQFGRAVKEGLLEDPDNRDAILEIASFASTHDAEKPTTLADYVSRMKDGQEHVYYMTGESRAAIEASPHMEAFRDRGYEVLLLTDPIDEVWVDQVPEFDGRELRSIAKGQVDLETEEQREEAEKRREEFSGFLEWMTSTLSEQVKDVRLSSRLTTSAACLVNDEHDMSPALEKMYRAMGQQMPHVKRILELNPSHPLVTALQTRYADAPDDAGDMAETAELLYGMALLAEGGDLDDPSRFVTLLAGRLQRSL